VPALDRVPPPLLWAFGYVGIVGGWGSCRTGCRESLAFAARREPRPGVV